jgi:hypothetical protein
VFMNRPSRHNAAATECSYVRVLRDFETRICATARLSHWSGLTLESKSLCSGDDRDATCS